MSNTKVVYENGGVVYIEPNYTSSDLSIRKSAETNEWVIDDRKMYAPELENYCVAIDLAVTVPERSCNGLINNNEGTYIMSWDGEKTTLSFFSGSEYNNDRFFTTAPYETTTFADVLNAQGCQTTTENFGIRSVDIEYNNYAVPQVTIEFTDIRGLSLFMPEEVRHSKIQGGISSSADQDIAGSFFKCFFMFPYPKFQLTAKGFYGEPVSYELTCSDFRAKFDCATGNFNATVKLIGYAFSILNDVTMTHLVAAPHETSIGAKYWDSKVQDGTFTFDDGTKGKLPKLTEIVSRVNGIRKALENFKQTDQVYQEAEDVSNQQTSNEGSRNELNNLLDYVKENCAKVQGKKIYDADGCLVIVMERNKEIEEKEGVYATFTKEFNEKAKLLEDSTKDIASFYYPKDVFMIDDGNWFVDPTYGPDALPNLNGSIKNGFLKVNENAKNTIKKNANDPQGTKAYLCINYKNLEEKLKQMQTKLKDKEDSVNSEIKRKQEGIVSNALGFRPTVENCTKILMAHFETLIKCIHETAIKAGSVNRSLSDLGIASTDVTTPNGSVPPYPRVDEIVTDTNGNQTKELGWLGNLTTADKAPEIELVEGFVAATKEVADLFSKPSMDSDYRMDGDYSGITRVSSTHYFGGLVDLINSTSWVGEVKTGNFAEVAAIAALRCFTTIGMNQSATATYTDDTFRNAWKYFAEQDAREFAKRVPEIDNAFKAKLKNTDDFSGENIIKCLDGTSKNLIVNNEVPWGKGALIKKAKGNYYIKSNGDNKIGQMPLKLQNDKLQTEHLDSDYLSNGASGRYKWFWSKRGLTDLKSVNNAQWKKLECNGLFKLDTNYKAYLELYNSFDNTDESSKDERQLIEPFANLSKIDGYYGDEFINNDMFVIDNIGDATPDYGDPNCVLPRVRPTEFKQSAFKGKGVIDYTHDNFGTANYTTRDKDNAASAIADGENDKYRICKLSGLDYDPSFTKKGCLFGDPTYYLLSNDYAKAFIFLATIDDPEFLDKAIAKIVSNDSDDDLCGFLPYYLILLMGGLLFVDKRGCEQILGKYTKASFYYKKLAERDSFSDLLSLRIDFKARLVNEFKAFTEGKESVAYSFKKIKEALELKGRTNKTLTYEEVKAISDAFNNNGDKYDDFLKAVKYVSMEAYVSNRFSENFCKTYFSIGYEKSINNIQLYIRPNSTIGKYLYNFIFHPCAFIQATTYLTNQGDRAHLEPVMLEEYLTAFFDQLKESYNLSDSDSSNDASDGGITTNTQESDENIRKGIYKYHKVLYDNWISGNDVEFWSINEFYKQNWHFIDSYYNRVGQSILMDITQFCDDLIYSQTQEGYSLLSYMSKTYATSRFSLNTVQNFLDLMDKTKFERMFDPIPYNEVNWGSVKKHPDFILLYPYEPSSKLNLGEGSAYSGDSFDICDEKDLPTAISMKNLAMGGYRIPAFGVTYGMQYQSYFKDIDVSMESPVITEQSLRAQYMLASAAVGKNSDGTNDSNENGNRIHFLGQDIFTIYANNSYTCNVTMMGCAWIQPLMYFQLNNIPLFRGAYLIQKVSHHIEPGNMETKFTGTRMAKVQTPKVGENVLLGSNGLTWNGSSPYELESGTQAQLDNNCDYKYFSPNYGSGQSVNVKGKVKKVAPNLSSAYDNATIAEALAATAYAAVGGHDMTAIKLALNVYYNRYCNKGWGTIFNKVQTECENQAAHDFLSNNKRPANYKEIVDIATEIFSKSPSILVGTTTKVLTPVPIYVDGKVTSQRTSTKTLTLEDVQTMMYYASPLHYQSGGKMYACVGGEYSETAAKANKNCAHFIKSKYICQHEWKVGNTKMGHVMLSGGKKYWEAQKPKSDKKTIKDPSEKITNIVESIKQTIDYSDNISIDTKKIKVTNGTTKGKSVDSVYLSTTEKDALPQIFDVIVNTYYPNDVKVVSWIYDSDSSSAPSSLYIDCGEKSKPQIVIRKGSEKTNTSFKAPKYSGVNSDLAKSLKKKFGPALSDSNVAEFKAQVKSFVPSEKNSEFIKNINDNVFNASLEECQLMVYNNGGSTYSMGSDLYNSASAPSLNGNKNGEYHIILHRYAYGPSTYPGKGKGGVAFLGVIYEAKTKKILGYTIESQKYVNSLPKIHKAGIHEVTVHVGGKWETANANHKAQAAYAGSVYGASKLLCVDGSGCLFHMGAGVNDNAGSNAWTCGCFLIGDKPTEGRNDRADFPFNSMSRLEDYTHPTNRHCKAFAHFYDVVGAQIKDHKRVKMEIINNWSGKPQVFTNAKQSNTQLSKHFTLQQMTKSDDVAKVHGLSNTPPPEAVEKLRQLCNNILEKIYEKCQFTVNSGYRSPEVNSKIPRASKTSQHMKGEAADIQTMSDTKADNKRLFDLIVGMIRNGEITVGQLIDESNYSWVHVSLPNGSKTNDIIHLK